MPRRSQSRLIIVLLLNVGMIAALVAVGLAAHSVAVLAAGVDYVADAATIAVSVVAIALARRPPTARRPNGYPNLTRIAALVNVGWLAVLNIGVIIAAARRLVAGAGQVDGLPVLIVSAVAAVVMLAGALILGGDLDDDDDEDVDEGEELNRRAVLLDTAADAAAAAGVAVSGGIILATGGWYWLDPTVALVIAVVIGYHAARLAHHILTGKRDAPRDSAPPEQ